MLCRWHCSLRPSALASGLLLLQQGTSIESIGTAANEMAKSPEGAKKHFIPEDERILQATKLLDPHSSETLRFLAPGKPGIYPYLCTFPGHWVLMKGETIVIYDIADPGSLFFLVTKQLLSII